MIRNESEETFYCDQWAQFIPGNRPALAEPRPRLQLEGSPQVDLTGEDDREGSQDVMVEDPIEDSSNQSYSQDPSSQGSHGHSGIGTLVPVSG